MRFDVLNDCAICFIKLYYQPSFVLESLIIPFRNIYFDFRNIPFRNILFLVKIYTSDGLSIMVVPQFDYQAVKHGYQTRLATFTNPAQYDHTTCESLAMAGFQQKGLEVLENINY